MLLKYNLPRHLIYANVIIQLFSVFNVPNHFGAETRAKIFRCLELELELKPEPEILIPAPQPCFRLLCSLQYKNAFARSNLLFVL